MALLIEPGIIGGAQLKRAAYLAGISEFEAFGRLARLWEESQRMGRAYGTVDELGFWLGASNEQEASRWVAAFSDSLSAFLTEVADGSGYYIRGNQKHIEKNEAIRDRNRRIALKKVTGTSPSGVHLESSTTPSGDHVVTSTSDKPLHLDSLNPSILSPPIPSHPVRSQAEKNKESPQGLKDGVGKASKTWLDTKRSLGQLDPRWNALEEREVARAIQAYGFEMVDAALFGARFEPSNDKFNPRDHIDVQRVLWPDPKSRIERITKHVERGQAARAKANAEADKTARQEAEEARLAAEVDELSPEAEEARKAVMARFGMIGRGGAA